MIVCKVLHSDCSPTKGVPTMLRQEFFAVDIILGIPTQFLGDESSIHLLWWVVVLRYLGVFCYFLTFGFFLQILAVDFINHNILAVSGVLLSRYAGFFIISFRQVIIYFQGVYLKHLKSYTPRQDQAKQYVQVCTGLYWYILVCTGTFIQCRYVLVHTGTYLEEDM